MSELKGLKGIQDELSEPEYKSILKDKLDVAVVNRLDTVFLTKKPAVWTWENVTKKQLQECLLEEFGCKADPVSVLLQQFGPSRLKKDPNESVSKFYHKFKEQLPALFYPETEAERKEFVDVVVRSLFYFSLEDKYLQQEISNIKDDPSLEKFYSEAVTAEAKRNSFRQIGVSSSQLDSSSGVSVSRWDTGSYNKKFPKKSESGAVKSEQNKKEKWQSPPPCSSLARSSSSRTSTVARRVRDQGKSARFASSLVIGLLTAIVAKLNVKVVAVFIVLTLIHHSRQWSN